MYVIRRIVLYPPQNYFQLSEEKLKCYTKKQLNQGYWI